MENLFSDPFPIGAILLLFFIAVVAFMSGKHKPTRSTLQYQLSSDLFALDLGILSVNAMLERYSKLPEYNADLAEKARTSCNNASGIADEIRVQFSEDTLDVDVVDMIARVETARVFLREARAALPDCCENDDALAKHALLDDVHHQVSDKHD